MIQNPALQRAEEFPTAVGYVLGYLVALAALPLLAHELPWRDMPLLSAGFVALVVALRVFQQVVIGDVLSPLRARAVMRRVDLASALLTACSVFVAVSFDARGSSDRLAVLLMLALATLVGCLIMLRQAREVWFSSTFLSRQEL